MAERTLELSGFIACGGDDTALCRAANGDRLAAKLRIVALFHRRGAENPWRASQARHRDRPDQRRQVYGAEEGASLAGVEDVPSQPCGWHCRNGPLCRADNLVPTALWIADHG